MKAIILAFLISLPTAWAWGKYIMAVHNGNALEAAWWDVVIVGLGQVGLLTIWDESKNKRVVLIAAMIGGAIGTYFTVQQ